MFFVLTGANFQLVAFEGTWKVAIAMFAVRGLSQVLACSIATCISGERRKNKYSWMAFLTQAGFVSGLSNKVQVMYPDWGQQFATVVVCIVLFNQILGPPLFKTALAANKEVGLAKLSMTPLLSPGNSSKKSRLRTRSFGT